MKKPGTILLMAVVLVAWDLAVRWLGLPPYLVPAPATVAAEIGTHGAELAAATAVTGMAALAGFLTSLVLGVVVGSRRRPHVLLRDLAHELQPLFDRLGDGELDHRIS